MQPWEKTPRAVRELEFLWDTAGIFACFLLFSVAQESVYKSLPSTPDLSWVPVLLVLLHNGVAALLALVLCNAPRSEILEVARLSPVMVMVFLAASSNAVSGALSNSSMLFVSFTTQALIKSCKPLSVFVAGLLFAPRGRYSARRVPSVLAVSVGLLTFLVLDHRVAREAGSAAGRHVLGVALAGASLLLDGTTAVCQDYVVARHAAVVHRPCSVWTLMLWITSLTALIALVAGVATGQLRLAVQCCVGHPAVLAWSLILGVAGASGQAFVYRLVVNFDSLTTCLVTTLRKFVTIVLSSLLFAHSLSLGQWLAASLVLGGAIYESLPATHTWPPPPKKNKAPQ